MIGVAAFFLPAVPLLALLLCLLLGRYPGHEAIVRLSERLASRSRRRPGTAARSRRPQPPPAAAALLRPRRRPPDRPRAGTAPAAARRVVRT